MKKYGLSLVGAVGVVLFLALVIMIGKSKDDTTQVDTVALVEVTPSPAATATITPDVKQQEARTLSMQPTVRVTPDTFDPMADFYKNVAFGESMMPKTYRVKQNDNIYSIAQKYNLNPNYILWNNKGPLGETVSLEEGVMLIIPPSNGLYYRWGLNDTLIRIAKRFNVATDQIRGWNELLKFVDIPQPNTMIFIPGGTEIGGTDPGETAGNERIAADYFSEKDVAICKPTSYDAIGDGNFIWPMDGAYISGYIFDTFNGHYGTDFGGTMGQALYAVDSGVVIYTGYWEGGYGAYTIIDHLNGWYSLYGHLSEWKASCGETVEKGQVIGLVGSTGRSSGPHLHFELGNVNKGGRVDPMTLISQTASQQFRP